MQIQNPHDKFFKKTFGEVDNAKDFLMNYLPESITSLVDIDSLKPEKDSYIDEELKESFSDLLFEAKINNSLGYLYFIFEHKSYPSQVIILQLLKYMVRIWERKHKELGRLPVAIPLVIYHGKKNWNVELELKDLILGYDSLSRDIKKLVPNYEYLLYDFSSLTDNEIKGEVRLRIAIKIMKDIQYKDKNDILETLYEVAILLNELESENTGLQYFELLVRYVFGARVDLDTAYYKKLAEKIETLYPKGSEYLMTLEERFKEEGLK